MFMIPLSLNCLLSYLSCHFVKFFYKNVFKKCVYYIDQMFVKVSFYQNKERLFNLLI